MTDKSRGMDLLIGETIVGIDYNAINVVHIHCASGKVVSIDADESHYGIPVVRASVGEWNTEEK